MKTRTNSINSGPSSRLIYDKSINSNLENIRCTCIEVSRILIANSIAIQDASDIAIALEEALSNIILHAFCNPKEACAKVSLSISSNGGSVDIDVIDSGNCYDLNNVRMPDIKSNLSGERLGGFGVHMIKKLMDSVVLVRLNNQNVLKMKKLILPSP